VFLVALGTAACSLNSPSSGRSLPVSVEANSSGLSASKCTLDPSGTRAIATGHFTPSYSLPLNMFGQPELREMQLFVLTSHGSIGGHDADIGDATSGISVGQTSWRLEATVEPGFQPTKCVVDVVPQN
jgi:hypothetical protein